VLVLWLHDGETLWAGDMNRIMGYGVLVIVFGGALGLVMPTPTPTPTPTPDPDAWTFCAAERSRCSFTGTQEVRYGANGTYTAPRTFTDGVDCTNAVFGDPLPGVNKHCDRRPVTTPPPDPTSPDPMGNNPPAGEPIPIAGKGYRQVLFDTFDTFNTAVWNDKLWYQTTNPAGTRYVKDGTLVLESRAVDNYFDVTVTTHNKRAFQHGYIECRSRFNGGPGATPACWTISQNWANGPSSCSNPSSLSAEIDIFEAQTSDSNYWSGNLHRHSGNHVLNCGTSSNVLGFADEPTGQVPDRWHTYAVEWTPTQVCWFFDNQARGCRATYDTFANNPQFILLWSAVLGSDGGWLADNYLGPTSPSVFKMETNWVRVWQK
jgi:hypothetical protein